MIKKFETWKSIFDKYMLEMINELQSDYLNGLGLTIKTNDDYKFNGGKSKWFAVYQKSAQEIHNGIILIGINYNSLYREMCKRHIDKDKFNIEAQARITIGHEIGHGLVDYIKNITITNDMPNIKVIKKCGARKEETLVEEFGEYLFPEATNCWCSVLDDALNELINY